MRDYIGEARERVRLREGRGPVERMLSHLYFHQPVATKLLARQALLPVPVATALKKELIRLGVLEQAGGVRLTAEGTRYLEEDLGFGGLDRELYQDLVEGGGADRLRAELCSSLAPLFEGRPSVDVTIDQAKGTVDTAVRRALLCLEHRALLGKEILCVGDDDLVSAALGFLLRRLYPNGGGKTRICVFEKDPRYTGYIRRITQEHGLPVECRELDLRDPLPLGDCNRFDCFFTDPPYTLEGMSLFLSRGVGALKREQGLPIFLSFGQKPIGETLDLQKALLAHGLVITGILPGFNHYEGASLLGNRGQMILLQTTGSSKALIPAGSPYGEAIYTGEQRPPDTRYRCQGCREEFDMGKRFSTVEELKERGCPSCGGKSFLQLRAAPPLRPNSPRRTALGEHILADFFGCSRDVLGDPVRIRACMREAANRANATIVSEDFHTFSPWGVSGAVIIQESHLTIHTWPEHEYAAVDLFTCGDSLDLWRAWEYLKEQLGSATMELTNVSRGALRLGGVDSSRLPEKTHGKEEDGHV